MKSRITLTILGLLFAGAIGLVMYGDSRVPLPKFHGKLADILPAAPAGWSKQSKEIADTPEMRQAVGELLNYDDGVFVDYTNAKGYRLSVYIAYWTPGKMSHRLVAGHTPDVCWVGNGWKRLSSEQVTGLKGKGDASLPPAEGRLFEINNTHEYVWFWHVIGDEVKSYGTTYSAPWYAPLTDLWNQGLNQREEQFFIRLSSGAPLTSSEIQPVLNQVLAILPLPVSVHPHP